MDARNTSVDPGSGRITVAQAARSLPDILDRVCDGRETFVIVDDGVELAVLSPIPKRRSRTVGELARLLQEIGMPDPDFAEDLEAIRGLGRPPLEPDRE